MKTFQDYKQEIDLIDFIIDQGYHLNRKKTPSNYRYVALQKGDHLLFVYYNKNKHLVQEYYDPSRIKDKSGDLIHYVLHQMDAPDYKSVNKILEEYSPVEVDRHEVIRTFKELKSGEDFSFDLEAYPMYNLKDKKFLYRRGIGDKTLSSKPFYNKVFNSKKAYLGKEYNLFMHSAVFPLTNEGNVVGLDIRNDGVKFFPPGTNKRCSFWKSATPENLREIKVFESPIDAMSYYEIQLRAGNEERLRYIDDHVEFRSVSGRISGWQVNALVEESMKGNVKLTTCFDQDKDGFKYDLEVLARYINKSLPGLNVQTDILDSKVILEVLMPFESLHKRTLNNLGPKLNVISKNKLGIEVPDPEDEADDYTVYESKFKVKRIESGKKDQFFVEKYELPLRLESIRAMHILFKQHIEHFKLDIEKSHGNDYNEDLIQFINESPKQSIQDRKI